MYLRNRREHQRKPINAEGWIAVPPGDTWQPINTVDVSKGGFAFVSPHKIEINAIHQFRLQLPNNAGLMNVQGRIAHCVELIDVGAYRLGVQTLSVDVMDMETMLPRTSMPQPDPKLDLVLTRTIDVPRKLVWAAWTMPQHLKKWFTPAPWKTVDCEIDLRPGGIFRTVMQGPDGQQFANLGSYLEIVENEKLVWTNALLPGYRPASMPPDAEGCNEFLFTAVIALEAQGNATKYTAIVLHHDEEGRKKHEAMGFYEGWNAALDQLVAAAKTL